MDKSPTSPVDATEQVTRDALRQSEIRFRRLFETAQDGILLINADTAQIEDVNPFLIKLLGYTHAEFLGKKLWEVGSFADVAECKSMFSVLQTDGYVRYEHLPLKTKDGRTVEVEFVSNAYSCDFIVVIQCNIRDISARVQAELALQVLNQQFRGLIEQVIAGIYIIQDGTFAYLNPRAAQIMGYESASALLGTTFIEHVDEPERLKVTELMRQLDEGHATNLAFDVAMRRPDGVDIRLGLNAAVATHLGRPALIGLMQDISEKVRAEQAILGYISELKAAVTSVVEVATIISEMRDPYTTGHERRVAEIAVAIGAELGFSAEQQEGLRIAGHLHDVGKIVIPSEILSKPGRLSAVEFQLVRGHATASYEILKGVKFPWPIAQIALQHHERIDGSGYPQGLMGDDILLEARVMAVADVIEAMSSHRPYRPGLGIDKALAEIESGRATAYDPMVVDACLRLFRQQGYQLPV